MPPSGTEAGAATLPTTLPPPTTCARALFASRHRRNSSSRARRLAHGLACITFVVDSGCTWHIHPRREDL
eukprot:5296135-Pleurochrysis_carterae.AAC.1